MTTTSMKSAPIGPEEEKTSTVDKTLTGLVYLLQILALATAGITLVITALINFLKWSGVKGTWLDSHFDWQLKTSLFVVPVLIIGFLTWQFGIGHFLIIGAAMWLVYRVVRGWLRFNQEQPMKEDDF